MKRALALAGVCSAYLVVVVPTSLMTPAWEANDEVAHVMYVQRIVLHRQLPSINPINGQESHQPPLFYAAASLWQRALGIDPFEPTANAHRPPTPVAINAGRPTRTLMLSHDYNPEERRHARYVHALRALSIAFGLGTVVLTFVAGRLASGRDDVALAAAAFVAFLPKFTVVSATVTNDSLVILLSSLLLVLMLAHLLGAPPFQGGYAALGIGAVAGAAFITKLNAVTLIPVVAAGILVARQTPRRKAVQLVLAAAGFFLVAGWWFTRNEVLYDQPLARGISRAYLRELIPGLIDPVPFWDADRFLYFVPEYLFSTFWYSGGWNQFIGPFALNFLLWLVVGVALFAWGRALLAGPGVIEARKALLLSAAALAGLAAIVVVAQTTVQAEGRVGYVGLSAFAVIAVAGLERAVGGSRRSRAVALGAFPALLFAYELYVIVRYVIPFRGL